MRIYVAGLIDGSAWYASTEFEDAARWCEGHRRQGGCPSGLYIDQTDRNGTLGTVATLDADGTWHGDETLVLRAKKAVNPPRGWTEGSEFNPNEEVSHDSNGTA